MFISCKYNKTWDLTIREKFKKSVGFERIMVGIILAKAFSIWSCDTYRSTRSGHVKILNRGHGRWHGHEKKNENRGHGNPDVLAHGHVGRVYNRSLIKQEDRIWDWIWVKIMDMNVHGHESLAIEISPRKCLFNVMVESYHSIPC